VIVRVRILTVQTGLFSPHARVSSLYSGTFYSLLRTPGG
jgi:hypothetical protein